MTDYPPNVDEFNKIAGLVFAQLYQAFPIARQIDRNAVARALNANASDQSSQAGFTIGDVVAHSVGWLEAEGFIRSNGAFPGERATLTTKGLAAMNAIPEGLGRSVGAKLAEATSPGSGGLSQIGDLIGGVLGGFTKSIGSG